jgi:hypothetical protein
MFVGMVLKLSTDPAMKLTTEGLPPLDARLLAATIALQALTLTTGMSFFIFSSTLLFYHKSSALKIHP